MITNGTAVLGLGNIGASASKPVMEGKAVLFKRFADVDAFDVEVDERDPARFADIVCALAPTFGGINLEDIRAPDCFFIEEECKRRCDIPVFHDDQHGTAIVAGAGLLNALELVGKRIDEVRVVFSGAGAAGFACAIFFLLLGVRRRNLVLSDVEGVVYRGRGDGNYLDELAADTQARTLAEAMLGADVFVGVSAPGIVTPEMLHSMASRPDRLRHGESGAGDRLSPRAENAKGPRDGDRAQRLSEPDQQRHRLSAHLPRRSRHAAPARSTRR